MDLAKELTKQKLNTCANEVRSLKQRLNVIEKEKTQILNRIKVLENNIKQTNIDRNFILDYCKIKKFVQ